MTKTNSPLLPFGLGVLFAISTIYGGWMIADGVFVGVTLYVVLRVARPPLWSVVLALAILPGLFFTDNQLATSTTVVRALTLPTVLAWTITRPSWNPTMFALGLVFGLAIQTVGLIVMIGHPRQSGLTVNASELAQVGLMLFLLIPLQGRMATAGVLGTATITLAAAASRVPIAGIAIFALLTRQKRWVVLAVVAASVAILIPSMQGIGRRFLSPTSLGDAARLRVELVTPSSTQAYGASSYGGDVCQPKGFTWHGYGAGSFGATTRCPRPHVAPLVVVYELGIFAVVPAMLALWAVLTGRVPWFLAVTLASVWLFVDEPLAIPFGHYTLAAVAAVWISRQDHARMGFAGLVPLKGWLKSSRRVVRPLSGRFLWE